MESGRKVYLDNIRWITVAIVVIYHVIYIFNGVQPYGVIGPFGEVQYQDAFMYFVYPWFMALLFVVAGMSSRYYLNSHSEKEFKRSRTVKLLVPSTIGLLVFHWTTGYFNVLISGALEQFTQAPKPVVFLILAVSGTGTLWFIQMLWFFSMLLLIVRKIEKDRLFNLCEKMPAWALILFVIPVYLFAQILNTPIVTVYRFGIYGFCFFVGYFVFTHDNVLDDLCKLVIPLDIAAIVLGISYTVLYFGENYALEPFINNVLACVYCWIAILAVFATMRKYGNFSNGFTEWMNKKSWGLYIFHYLPLAAAAVCLHNIARTTPTDPILKIASISLSAQPFSQTQSSSFITLTVYIIVAIAAFAGAYLLDEIIRRIPVVRWCVLGVEGKKGKRGETDV